MPFIIGSNSNETSVALAFGLEPVALVEKLGKARILVKSLYRGVADDAELGRQVLRDVAFTAFAQRGKPEASAGPAWPSDSLWRPTVLTFWPDAQQLPDGGGRLHFDTRLTPRRSAREACSPLTPYGNASSTFLLPCQSGKARSQQA